MNIMTVFNSIDWGEVFLTGLYVVFAYYLVMYTLYLGLMFLGAGGLKRYHSRIKLGDMERIRTLETAPPISVIVPAWNEEKIIVNTVLNALHLDYLHHEVIVVSDGSTDQTIAEMVLHFDLKKTHKIAPKILPTEAVKAVYQSAKYPNLLVIDKENGRRADAINVGINHASYPLVCVIDADCVFEKDALIRSARPFVDNDQVIAAGGIVRPSNGLVVDRGEIVDHDLPHTFLGLAQMVEYLRSFQWARMGLAKLGSMLCISGAFLIAKRQTLIDMGGMDKNAITDDIEFTMRLHRYVHDQKKPKGSVVYIPDPICYTEVPETWRIYSSQRNRWQRGTLQALWKHKKMLLNPKYKAAGLFGMPFFWLFEGLSGVIEFLGYVFAFGGFMMGLVGLSEILIFLVLAVVLGTLLSLVAILMQEHTRVRVRGAKDLFKLTLVSFAENLGLHQWSLLVRVWGTVQFLFGRKDLGSMERKGHQQPKRDEPHHPAYEMGNLSS